MLAGSNLILPLLVFLCLLACFVWCLRFLLLFCFGCVLFFSRHVMTKDCVWVLYGSASFAPSFHKMVEFIPALINWQYAACKSVLIDLAKAERRWTEKNLCGELPKAAPASVPAVPKPSHFFLGSEPVAFRWVFGLESYSRTSGESNHHRQSVSDTGVRYQLHHEDDCSAQAITAITAIPILQSFALLHLKL